MHSSSKLQLMLVKMAHRQKHPVCSQHRIQKIYQIISSAKRVGFFNIGSGIGKNMGSRLGSGRVGVSKYTNGYFRVSFLLSGISDISRYFRVFLGSPVHTKVIF